MPSLLKRFLLSLVIFISLSSWTQAQSLPTRLECSGMEVISGGATPGPSWQADPFLKNVEIASIKSQWHAKAYDVRGNLIFDNVIFDVRLFQGLQNLHKDHLKMIASALNTNLKDLSTFHRFTLNPDSGDGTGFYILNFFKLESDNKYTDLGSVYFNGLGFGRCSQ